MILVVGDVVDDIGVRPLEQLNFRSDTRAEIRMTQGGSAANVAAWLGSNNVPTRFLGKVGTDGVNRHTAALSRWGVDTHILATDELPTATIVLTLDEDADRTMFVDRGANQTLSIGELPARLWYGVKWLHLTGYTFFDPATREVAQHLMAEALRRDVGISIDPSSAGFLQQAGPDQFIEWTAGASMIVPNLEEARVLVGATGAYVNFNSLAEHYEHVVVKMGAMGSGYLSGQLREQYISPRIGVLDTTGAGDAFIAGFLSEWCQGQDPKRSLTAGAAMAERCIALRGARP